MPKAGKTFAPEAAKRISAHKQEQIVIKIDEDPQKKPKAIVGATDMPGELCFQVDWKGTKELSLVPARVMNKKWPMTVIKFYEERLQWASPDSDRQIQLDRTVELFLYK